MFSRKGRFGLPLYELGLGMLVAAVVLGVAAYGLDLFLEFGEKTAVDTMVMNIRSGIRLEKARRIVAGSSLQDLTRRNPLEFLDKSSRPAVPAEMLNSSDAAESFDWYYESQQSVLTYRPSRHRRLKLQREDADMLLSWQIRARSADGADADLVVVYPYQWF
jgi:hypothetical protein